MPVTARAPYALVTALLFVSFADEWTSFFPAGLLEAIRSDINLTYAQAGLILTALPAGGLLGHIFTIAADYVSRRWLAAGGALVYGLCMIAFALADSLVVLVLASFLWGAAGDALVSACEVALVDAGEGDSMPLLARTNALGSIGDLLAPLTLAAAAALGIGWRAVFLGGGVSMLAYAACLGLQRFPPPRPPDEAGSPLAGVVTLLRDRRVLVLALIAGLFSLLDEPLLGFIIAYAEQVQGLSGTAATGMAAAVVGGGLSGYLAATALARRLGTRRLLLVAGAAVGATLFGVIFAPNEAVRVPAGIGFGMSGAVFWSVIEAAYLSLRPGQAGTTSAVVSVIGMAGIGFPTLAGTVADAHGLTAGLLLYAAVPVVMLALVALSPSATHRGSDDDA